MQGEPATTVTVTASEEHGEPPFTEEAAPTEEPSPEEGGPIKFGQTFAYEDGLKVSVTKAERGTVSGNDTAGSPGDPKVIVTVKITNDTRKNFNALEVEVTLTYGDDYAIEGRKNLDDLLVEVIPSFEHEPAIFEGAAK